MQKINYALIKTDRKTIALQIKNGEIIVRAPKRIKKKDIDRFVLEHFDWIEQHLAIDRVRREQIESIEPLSEDELLELKVRARAYIPRRDNYSHTAIIKKPRYHNGFRGFLFAKFAVLVQIWCKSIKKAYFQGVQCGFVLYAFLRLWWSNTSL